MRHAREDYDRIQDPAGLIPADEPVFLLRAKDMAAPEAVRAWANRAAACGADPEIVGLVWAQARLMEEWQASIGGGTIPDLPAGPTGADKRAAYEASRRTHNEPVPAPKGEPKDIQSDE